jgi:hypothetical protein
VGRLVKGLQGKLMRLCQWVVLLVMMSLGRQLLLLMG